MESAEDIEVVIARVLAAEARARARVAQAERDAQTRVEVERAGARQLEARTGSRLSRWLARIETEWAAQVAAIQADAGPPPSTDTQVAADVARCVTRVAADLTHR